MKLKSITVVSIMLTSSQVIANDYFTNCYSGGREIPDIRIQIGPGNHNSVKFFVSGIEATNVTHTRFPGKDDIFVDKTNDGFETFIVARSGKSTWSVDGNYETPMTCDPWTHE